MGFLLPTELPAVHAAAGGPAKAPAVAAIQRSMPGGPGQLARIQEGQARDVVLH